MVGNARDPPFVPERGRRTSGGSAAQLGRCSPVPANDPDFGQSESEVAAHWCEVSGIPYVMQAYRKEAEKILKS